MSKNNLRIKIALSVAVAFLLSACSSAQLNTVPGSEATLNINLNKGDYTLGPAVSGQGSAGQILGIPTGATNDEAMISGSNVSIPYSPYNVMPFIACNNAHIDALKKASYADFITAPKYKVTKTGNMLYGKATCQVTGRAVTLK